MFNVLLAPLVLLAPALSVAGVPPKTLAAAADTSFYKPPIATPFIQLRAISHLPVNTTTPTGVVASSANGGGNVTGSIVGTILPVGAGFERLSNEANGAVSFYENRFQFQNAENETFLVSVTGVIHYANDALHALGWGKFETQAKGFEQINYNTYLAEVVASFNTGIAEFEFFEVNTGGRVDGQPIRALLTPEEAAALDHEEGSAGPGNAGPGKPASSVAMLGFLMILPVLSMLIY